MKALPLALWLATVVTVNAELPLEKPAPPPVAVRRPPFQPGDKVRVRLEIPWTISAYAYGIVVRVNEGNTADVLFIKVGGDTSFAPGLPFSILEKP